MPVDEVEEVTYLRGVITKNGVEASDILVIVRKSLHAFGQLKPVWNSRQLTIKLKLRLYNTNVKSVLL